MKKKSLADKCFHKLKRQILMFGHDNSAFKSINMPKKQYFADEGKNFELKKLIKKDNLFLKIIYISKI